MVEWIQKKEKIVKVMKMVIEDVRNDAAYFDGQPFNGKTVATYMGNHGAAIKAVADAVIAILEYKKEEEKSAEC